MNTRQWLRQNKYDDIADMIDEVISEWQAAGKRTRRNWWDVLAGDKNGQSCERGGRKFPVLRAAQLRQGKPVTENAICRNPLEEVPPVVISGRWSQKA
jgi:hypothetical protein